MATWYAVHTHVHAEAKAAGHLARQGFAVYLPRYLKRRRHARRMEQVQAPLFPRYLFVAPTPENMRWRAINSTVGVCYVISHGGEPTAVPLRVIDEIRRREDNYGFVALGSAMMFRRGDKVKILDGPMAEHIGIFEAATDEDRVTVLLDLLGRQVRVKVPSAVLTRPI